MTLARWLRWQLRWRVTAIRRQAFQLWHLRLHPSAAQRDYDSGDPERRARVEALAARIVAELTGTNQEQEN